MTQPDTNTLSPSREAFEAWIKTKRVGKAQSELVREMYEDVLWQAFNAGWEAHHG